MSCWEKSFLVFVLVSSWLPVNKMLVFFGVIFYTQVVNCLGQFVLSVFVHTYKKGSRLNREAFQGFTNRFLVPNNNNNKYI